MLSDRNAVWFRHSSAKLLSRSQTHAAAISDSREIRRTYCRQPRLCRRSQKMQAMHQSSSRALAASTAEALKTEAKKFCTWTNTSGKVLTDYGQGVWGAERPFIWNSIDVNGRGAILKLSDGSLWVHSPVGLDPELKAAVDALGEVKHIISPNFEHVSFAKQWIEAYPNATSHVCPGGQAKLKDIPYNTELSRDNQAPAEWLGEIEPVFLGYENVPVLNKPFFNEVVFVHVPSGTLIATDLIWNYPSSYPNGTSSNVKLWKFGMDRVYLPFYRRFMIGNKEGYKAAFERLMDQLEWDAVLPCHGNYIGSGGKQFLKAHLKLQ